MNGFQKRTQLKMNKIEQCTVELLVRPINEITVAGLAKQAGVSQVTIYNYYGSKEALMKEALKRLFEDALDEFKRLLDSDLTFNQKLKQMILNKRRISSQVHPDTFTSLISKDSEMQAFMLRYSQENSIPLFLQFIHEGRERGRLRSTVRDETLLLYLNLFTHALTHLGETEFNQINQTGVAEDLTDLFFYGIINPTSEEEAE